MERGTTILVDVCSLHETLLSHSSLLIFGWQKCALTGRDSLNWLALVSIAYHHLDSSTGSSLPVCKCILCDTALSTKVIV